MVILLIRLIGTGKSTQGKLVSERLGLRRRALARFAKVVLLLPSPDDDESVRLLRERTGSCESNGVDFHDHFVRHPSNRRLAKHVVYAASRTSQQTRDEIIGLVGAAPAPVPAVA